MFLVNSRVQGVRKFNNTIGIFMYDRVFKNGEIKYAMRIFQRVNGVAMTTKFRQKKQNWNKLGHNLDPRQTTFGICVQRTCLVQ